MEIFDVRMQSSAENTFLYTCWPQSTLNSGAVIKKFESPNRIVQTVGSRERRQLEEHVHPLLVNSWGLRLHVIAGCRCANASVKLSDMRIMIAFSFAVKYI